MTKKAHSEIIFLLSHNLFFEILNRGILINVSGLQIGNKGIFLFFTTFNFRHFAESSSRIILNQRSKNATFAATTAVVSVLSKILSSGHLHTEDE